MTLLKRGTTKNIAVLTHDSIMAYREILLKDINLNVRITLDDKTYLTKVSEWDNDIILILAPLEQLDWVILPTSRYLETNFISKTALYSTQLQILTSIKQENNLYYSCKIVKPLIRKQQRQFFRLDATIDATYIFSPTDITIPLPANSPQYKGTIVNISVGGVCLVCTHRLEPDTLVYLTFTFLETTLSLIGQNLLEGERTRTGAYSHRIKFKHLCPQDENILHRLIMTKQRLMRKYI